MPDDRSRKETFRELLGIERHEGVDSPPTELDRRALMKLLGAGASLAGLGTLAGCMERPTERILPRVEQPPEMTPGIPLEYATSMAIDGFATGLVAQTIEARPIKIDGNPEHPASLGKTTAIHQASVLDLYDPHRAAGALEHGVPRAMDEVIRSFARREQMPGLWFLLNPQSSLLTSALMARIRERHPSARFAFHSPLERRWAYEGAQLAFGRPLDAQYRFDRAEVVVSFDADFMAAMPNSVRWSHDFALRRRLESPRGEMGRLYIAEPTPTPTGSLADHRAPVAPSEVVLLAAGVLGELARSGAAAGIPAPLATALARVQVPVQHRDWVAIAARDLASRRGRGLAVAGDQQPPAVHALVHVINAVLGNQGETVFFTEPALLEPLGDGLAELAAAAAAGEVETLVVADANPVYTAPADLDMAALIASVPESLCVSLYRDETAAACRFFFPMAHYLESWGDARAYDGTISLIQPMIRPLYRGLSLPDLLAIFAGEELPSAYRLLRELHGVPVGVPARVDLLWQAHLKRGFLPGSDFPPVHATLSWSPAMTDAVLQAVTAPPPREDDSFELYVSQSHAVYDGRFAGNGWLQELPKPITKLTWDNAALMSPITAELLGLSTGDVVRLELDGRELPAPILPVAGQAEGTVTLELGYGRWAGGPIAEGVGVNTYHLRTAAARGFGGGLRITRTGESYPLATTQKHWNLAGRDNVALQATLAEYRANTDFTSHLRGPVPSWLPDLLEDTPKWGMSIDTTICSGCSSCVVACQAENNIPLVGKEGVLHNREMHWLRIDTYNVGREIAPDVVINQPMLCQHCEKAPCEYVCPTYATQHSPDGLNEMIYNRCIGTRFCSNNCPYKVRRFNWFDYTGDTPKPLQLVRNPNVTVRARGVMEKCTYCVQRIRRAEIGARMEDRDIRPGEVETACQQACPTGAIRFGQLHHEDTAVVQWRRQPRQYAALHDLGTQPRTLYLAKIRNPNPDLG